MREYAVYKGDKLIMIGTAEEIAKKFGATLHTRKEEHIIRKLLYR